MEKITEKLPREFLDEMQKTLGEDYQKYLDSIGQDPVRGLRVNTNRISTNEYLKNYGKQLDKVPFSTDGFVFQ